MTTCTGHWEAPTNPPDGNARTDTHVVQNGGPVCGAWINDSLGMVWCYMAHGARAELVECADCLAWIEARSGAVAVAVTQKGKTQ